MDGRPPLHHKESGTFEKVRTGARCPHALARAALILPSEAPSKASTFQLAIFAVVADRALHDLGELGDSSAAC